MKQKIKTLLALLLWAALISGIYFGLGDTPYTVFITGVYAAAAVILALFFLLVNGGLRSLPSTERLRSQKKERERAEEKKALHPPKRRRPATEKKAEPTEEFPPRPDLFHLGEEGQEKAARILLILAAPFFLVLVADWIYLHYFLR